MEYFHPFPKDRRTIIPKLDKDTGCPKCGMVCKGVMMYPGPASDCPVQPKVTC